MSQLILKHPDFQPENVKFDTVEVHAGEPRDTYGSLIPPIYQTSTFYFASTDDAVKACGDYAESFAYSRITNPSLDYMEQKLAALEHGKGAAVSYASGMGAVAGALFAALKCGDHVIFTKAKYSSTQDITSDWLPRFGIGHDSFQADHLEELEPLIKPNTKVIYVETPANPTMVLVNLAEVAKIARWLEADPRIETVRYPFLESNPQYDIAKKQMRGGGMISFDVKGGLEAGKKFINSLKLCTLAVSLGDTETLVEQAAAMTHTMIPKEVREAAGITDGMIRMSVGLEDPDDIIADLDQALSR